MPNLERASEKLRNSALLELLKHTVRMNDSKVIKH